MSRRRSDTGTSADSPTSIDGTSANYPRELSLAAALSTGSVTRTKTDVAYDFRPFRRRSIIAVRPTLQAPTTSIVLGSGTIWSAWMPLLVLNA